METLMCPQCLKVWEVDETLLLKAKKVLCPNCGFSSNKEWFELVKKDLKKLYA